MQEKRQQLYPSATKQRKGKHNAWEKDEERYEEERQRYADCKTKDFASSITEENHCSKEEEEVNAWTLRW